MRVSGVYENKADVYVWQNNYLNNSSPQVGGEGELRGYTAIRQTCMYMGK